MMRLDHRPKAIKIPHQVHTEDRHQNLKESDPKQFLLRKKRNKNNPNRGYSKSTNSEF